jgi:hypothetical protein
MLFKYKQNTIDLNCGAMALQTLRVSLSEFFSIPLDKLHLISRASSTGRLIISSDEELQEMGMLSMTEHVKCEVVLDDDRFSISALESVPPAKAARRDKRKPKKVVKSSSKKKINSDNIAKELKAGRNSTGRVVKLVPSSNKRTTYPDPNKLARNQRRRQIKKMKKAHEINHLSSLIDNMIM